MADMKKLYKAVKKHSGMDDGEIRQAGEHGADAGWSGFTYYTDTVKFHDDNEDLIWDLLEEERDGLGEKTILSMLAGFGAAGGVESMDQLKNLLAWWALESVGRWLEDNPQAGAKTWSPRDR